jgi:hypothetical protein
MLIQLWGSRQIGARYDGRRRKSKEERTVLDRNKQSR